MSHSILKVYVGVATHLKAIFATATFVTGLSHLQIIISMIGPGNIIGSVSKSFFDPMIDKSADDVIDVVDVKRVATRTTWWTINTSFLVIAPEGVIIEQSD